MRKLVYIASPLSGDVEQNLDFARQACLNAMAQGVTPFAPHLLYTQMLDDNDPSQRELGMQMGNQMLALCDELWLCGDRISPGMASEEQLAKSLLIPVKTISSAEILNRPPDDLHWEKITAPEEKADMPAAYAVWMTGIPDGPLSGQSGYLTENGKPMLFHDLTAAEQKLHNLQNRLENGGPIVKYSYVSFTGPDQPDRMIDLETIDHFCQRSSSPSSGCEPQDQMHGDTGSEVNLDQPDGPDQSPGLSMDSLC